MLVLASSLLILSLLGILGGCDRGWIRRRGTDERAQGRTHVFGAVNG
jgi:hypothetical protein